MMTGDEFLSIAKDKISDDPKTRLTGQVKSALNEPECLIDIHAHIFDRHCLTVSFILLRMLKNKVFENLGLESFDDYYLLNKNEEEIYNELAISRSSEDVIWEQLFEEIEMLSELTEEYELFGYKIKDIFDVLRMQDMLEIFDFYINNYSIINIPEYSKKPFVTGILMMDLETGWEIISKKNLSQQIQEIKTILNKRAILPFLPVDPRRCDFPDEDDNLYELFLKAFIDKDVPFFGIKCYPSLGYLPSDIRLDPIFQICSEKNIPIMTHCGGELISTFKKNIQFQNSQGKVDFSIPGSSRTERARFLNDPIHWEPVLNKYNNLKLCFGHFGGDANWENQSFNGNNDRIEKIISMINNSSWRVFADFSYNVIENRIFEEFKKVLDINPNLCERIIYGTDFWVVLSAGDLLARQKDFLIQLKDHQKTLLNYAPLKYILE